MEISTFVPQQSESTCAEWLESFVNDAELSRCSSDITFFTREWKFEPLSPSIVKVHVPSGWNLFVNDAELLRCSSDITFFTGEWKFEPLSPIKLKVHVPSGRILLVNDA